jgi:hypothetical protein
MSHCYRKGRQRNYITVRSRLNEAAKALEFSNGSLYRVSLPSCPSPSLSCPPLALFVVHSWSNASPPPLYLGATPLPPSSPLVLNCDRTPLKKQRIIFQDLIKGFLTKREFTNTYISIKYHDIQVIKLLLHIKWHVLRFKRRSSKMLQHRYQSFCGSDISHDKHTLFTL